MKPIPGNHAFRQLYEWSMARTWPPLSFAVGAMIVVLACFTGPSLAATSSIEFNGSTSKLENTAANVLDGSDTMTIVAWIYATGTGEGSFGRVVQLDHDDTSGAAISLRHANVVNQLQFQTRHSSGQGVWSIAATDNQWNAVAVAYDKSSTSNHPTARVNFAAATVTLLATPAGTKPTPTGYCIGNRNQQDLTWSGRIACVQVFNTVLTDAQMDQAARIPGSVKSGLRLYLPMQGASDVNDRSGNGLNGTATSLSTGTDGPPNIWANSHYYFLQ